MFRQKLALGVLSFLALVAFGRPAAAQVVFDDTPNAVTILGSGCPAGTAVANILGNSLIVSFDSFLAGAGTRPTANCSITARLKVLPGVSVNVARVNYSGSAVLGGGSAMLSRRAFFAGGPAFNATNLIAGDGPFSFPDVAIFPTVAACNGASQTALVGTTVNLTAINGAFVDLATVDASVQVVFNINPCP